jgi:hypothetical protein
MVLRLWLPERFTISSDASTLLTMLTVIYVRNRTVQTLSWIPAGARLRV